MSALLQHLQRIKGRDDRGALADLRCALQEHRKHRAWPIIAGFGGIGDSHHARVTQTIAGLYAHHPKISDSGNMGDICLALMSDDERKDYLSTGKAGAMSRRFQHLLAASYDEICARVVRIIFYAKSKEVPVNYEQLQKDLEQWDKWPESVKIRWAKIFWKAAEKEVAE